ncbi:unnamed protein product [Cladocopium goreaui]|uniref:Uncharacterized protein n=1 Tax=Cladocopium goreaui TaxID=2562237 RepID=A0A9P1D5H7_9DINO|nr:unnamed protein product [Cladocopium goreaui]
MATFREDRNGEAEQRSLLRAEPGGAPQRRLRVSAGGAAGILAVTALVAVLGVPELFQSKSFGTESGSKELQEKAIETPQLGGTLVPGPGCPVACGSFVQCATDRRSKNNLLPLTYTADLLGLAYDRSTGFVNLLPQIAPLIPSIRLANKQVVPRTPEFQCPNSTCWIPRAFLNDDYCDCPGCEDEEFHRCEDCGVGLPPVVDDVCPDRRCKLYGSDYRLNNLFYVPRQACLGTGLVTDPFTCPDPNGGISGCIIDKNLVDDLRCDCPGTCADEADYTCENCSCPIFCGLPSRWSCDPSIGVFECPEVPPYPGRCAIPESRVNDGICDCPWTCADEEPRQSFRGQEFPVNCDWLILTAWL